MEKRRLDRKRVFRIFLLVLFNAGVIAWTAFREFGGHSGEEPVPRLGPSGPLWMTGALFCLFLTLLAGTVKYLLMMHAAGERLSVRVGFEATVLGKYYDFITPSGIGGEPFQIWWLRRYGYSSGSAGAMPIIGFVTMQAGFIIPALLTMLIWQPEELDAVKVSAYIGIVLFMIVPGLLLWFSVAPRTAQLAITWAIRFLGKFRLVKDPDRTVSKILGTLSEYHDSFRILAGRRGLPVLLFLLSVVFRFSLYSIPWFVLRAMGSTVAYGPVLALTVYLHAAVVLIPTPGNAGAAEGLFYLIFSSEGAEGVFWAMLIWRLLTFYFFLAAGALIQGIRAATDFRVPNETPAGDTEPDQPC